MHTVKFVIATLIAVYISATSCFAEVKEKLTIGQATVFLNGAELHSTGRVALPQGESEVLFTNVAGNVNQQSLIISASDNVVIQSATFQNNYLVAEILSPRARAIKDSIQMITDGRSGTTNQLTVVEEQINILSQNKQLGGETKGVSVAELSKMLDLVKSKLAALLTEKDKLNAILRKTDERLQLLRLQLDIEQKKDFQPGGQLLVKFFTKSAIETDIKVSYVVPNAGWTPSYDLRVDNVKDPVKLFYKANVYQNSGVKWDKVKLTLSTGNPNEGAQAPILNPWYLNFYTPVVYGQGYTNTINVQSYKSIASSEDLEKMPTRNTNSVVNLGGAKADGTAYIIDGVRVYGNQGQSSPPVPQQTINNYVQTDNSGINTSFDIDLDYTIPSDGQGHLVAIKEHELPATYRYYAIPKMDKDAFLLAQITKWEDLNLLPAVTNIFYEGSYVGQGFIDVRNVKDTMNLSLGRDKKIVIRRERDKELRSTKTIGTNIRETFAYTISVRNTRKEPINLTLVDQLPVSNNSDIVVEDPQSDGAETEETTGMVKWKLTVAPNETQKKKIGFTVKYPKGKSLGL